MNRVIIQKIENGFLVSVGLKDTFCATLDEVLVIVNRVMGPKPTVQAVAP